MTFDYSVPGRVRISMEGYVQEVLMSCEVKGKANTPAKENLFTINELAEKLLSPRSKLFHSRVAKLLYLGTRVRPEILTPIIFLTTRVKSPDVEDWDKLDRVLRYLNGTQDLCLTIELDAQINVLAYIDCSHGVHANGRGHSGSVISLGKGAVHASSAKQKLVSKSSTETELIGLTDKSSQVIWSRNFLIEQGHQVPPAKIFQDNMVEKGRSTNERTRHIHVRYYFIKDRVLKREIKLDYLPTGEMVADILTKPLQGSLFRTMRAKLLNLD